MNRFALGILALVSALAASLAPHAAAENTPELRLLVWNIHTGRGLDGKLDLERIANTIRQHKPDAVLLQEVDLNCRRTGTVDQPAELARLLEMNHLFGKAMDHDGGEYGQAILSPHPLREPQIHRLPGQGEPRIAFSAILNGPLGEIIVASIHLDHKDPASRLAQAQVASEALLNRKLPVALAGDFNDTPGSRALSVFNQAPWTPVPKQDDKPTFPANEPKTDIDHIILRGLLPSRPATVIEEPIASDHRPILSILRK